MHEILEAHDSCSSKLPDNGGELEPEPDFDPKSMRKTKPGLKRLSLTLFVLFSFLLAPKCFNNYTLSVTVDAGAHCLRSPASSPCSWSCLCGSITAIDFDYKDDVAVDDRLESVFGGKTKEYIVVVVKGENERAVVGKHRHPWRVVGGGGEVEIAALKISEVLLKALVNGGKEQGSIRNEFMPVGADGRIILSFNLLNGDPRDWVYDWDFQKIDRTTLAPMIDALGPVANISVESQVLYHTPKAYSLIGIKSWRAFSLVPKIFPPS